MNHALIVDDNMAISRAIKNRLSALGFESFDQTWTEDQAVAAAASRTPDLVVLGHQVASGSPINIAKKIAEKYGAPMLLVAAGRCEVRKRVAEGVTLEGPFSLTDIGSAVAAACGAEKLRQARLDHQAELVH